MISFVFILKYMTCVNCKKVKTNKQPQYYLLLTGMILFLVFDNESFETVSIESIRFLQSTGGELCNMFLNTYALIASMASAKFNVLIYFGKPLFFVFI